MTLSYMNFQLRFFQITMKSMKKQWSPPNKGHILSFYPFPKQTHGFTCPQCKSFKNTVGKGEIVCKK